MGQLRDEGGNPLLPLVEGITYRAVACRWAWDIGASGYCLRSHGLEPIAQRMRRGFAAVVCSIQTPHKSFESWILVADDPAPREYLRVTEPGYSHGLGNPLQTGIEWLVIG